MQDVDISVLITSMEDRSRWLSEALDSVARQTRLPDEVVLVLEGNDPGWPAVLRAYDPLNLRVVHVPVVSGRPGPGKNRALREARGRFLVLLDDDDRAFPDRIEGQVAYLEEHPDVDFVAAPMVYEGGGKDGTVWPDPGEAGPLTLERLLAGNRILYSSVTLRRSALAGFPGFPEDRVVGEDYWAWLTLVASGRKGVLLSKPAGIRRVHDRNMSTPGGMDLEWASIRIAEAFLHRLEDPARGKDILGARWRHLAKRFRAEGRDREASEAFLKAYHHSRRPGDLGRACWMRVRSWIRKSRW